MKSFLLLSFLTLLSCSTPPKEKTYLATEPQGVRVASLNYQISGGKSLDEVSRHLEKFISEAAANKAAYILIPELIVLDLFSINPSDEEVKKELDIVALQSKAYLLNLRELSAKYQVSIVGASYIEKKGSNYLNRAVYIKPNDEVYFQDKVHPTPWEIRFGFKGANEIKKFQSKDFSFAILICHDAEFPEISTSLIFKRPEVLFVPSQTDDFFGLNRVKYTSSARAIEHMSYVIMTGTSSLTEAPWHTYQGRNILFTPQNKYFSDGLVESGLDEELSYYDLNLDRMREARKDLKQVYPARDFKRL